MTRRGGLLRTTLVLVALTARFTLAIVVVAENGTKVRFEGDAKSSGVTKRSGYGGGGGDVMGGGGHHRQPSPSSSHGGGGAKRDGVVVLGGGTINEIKETKTLLKGEPSQIYGSAVGGYGSHHAGGYHSSHYGSTGHGLSTGPSYGGSHSHHHGLPPTGLYGHGHHGGDHPLEPPPYEHGHHEHGHHDLHTQKQQALKSLLLPLVGVALLGAAAAFVTNPILLQLGVISTGGYGYGRRRRRDAPGEVATETEILRHKLNELAVLEKYMSEVPPEEAVTQEKRLLANYLSCSGGGSSENGTGINCLERLTCELHRPDSVATELERHVMGIVTSEILLNEFVPAEVKNRVKNATSTGADSRSCSAFPCFEIEGPRQRK